MHLELRVNRAVRQDLNRVILDGHDITDSVRAEGLAVDLTDTDRPLVHLVLMPKRLDVDLADALVDVLQAARTERAEHHQAQAGFVVDTATACAACTAAANTSTTSDPQER